MFLFFLSMLTSQVRAVVSPSDEIVFSASRDQTVRSWQLAQKPAVNPLFANTASKGTDEVEIFTFSQHVGFVNSLAYHSEGIFPHSWN
jgi:WD40 repeat protein